MSEAARSQYQQLMTTIRSRLDLIASVRSAKIDTFSPAELCAFHGRKIVEGIAFGCIVAFENGLKHLPRDASGQWNADKILSVIQSKKGTVFPSPSEIRLPTQDELRDHGSMAATISGLPENRMTIEELKTVYRRMHRWLHEINPYIDQGRDAFLKKNESTLWDDLTRIDALMARHTISIGGEMFFCVLRDKNDGPTKVIGLSKIASLYPKGS